MNIALTNLLASKAIIILPLVALACLFVTSYSRADIYRYEDDEGIVHFTDAPTDKRFKIFMRDLKKDKELRTKLKYAASVNAAEYDQIIRAVWYQYSFNEEHICFNSSYFTGF